MKPRDKVFICYRREGGTELAKLVYDNLEKRGFKVFMDIEDLRSGPFNESLLKEIESATDVVVILPLGAMDRCYDEGDWLRWEIRHAIECNKNVVPVKKRGFVWPEKPLPGDLEKLPYYQSIEASTELFDASMSRLHGYLIAKPDIKPSSILLTNLWKLGATVLVFVGGWLWLSPDYSQSNEGGEPPVERPERDGWVKMFDGHSLSGWTAPNPGDWQVKDGVLIGHRRSHLFSPYTYTNVEFKAEVNLSHHANSGMFLHTRLGKGFPRGVRAILNNTAEEQSRTGSLKVIGAGTANMVRKQLIADDTWFTNHVICINNRFVILVNGKIVCDVGLSRNPYASGLLALQQINPDTTVMFRNVSARRLPEDEIAALAIASKDLPELRLREQE